MQASETETALRAHFRAHNTSVLAGSGVAAVFSAIGWAILYGASFWLTMFVLTVLHVPEGRAMRRLDDVFVYAAIALLVMTRVKQWLHPNERAVDSRPPFTHFMDVLLFVPRFTLSVWQNLSALASLGREDMRIAADLLDRLREAGKIPVQQLAVHFPNDRCKRRVLGALTDARLLDRRTAINLTWLSLSGLAPAELRSPRRRSAKPRDAFEEMPRAKVVEPRDPAPGGESRGRP